MIYKFLFCILLTTTINNQLSIALNYNKGFKDENGKDVEQMLIEKLFKDYNKKIRPSGTVEVKFSLNINQIVNLLEKDQIMVINAYVDHEWVDKRLKWGKHC